jgi:hypothetical protein
VEKTRTDLLNFLAEKYNLQRYLEIGVQYKQNFNKIICRAKVGVDPDPASGVHYCMTSDAFFTYAIGSHEYDLIFIDGLHTAEQVKKDFENALKVLSPNGFIVLHDCNPEKEEHTIVPRPKPTGHWNGSCYKFAAAFHGYHRNRYTVDIDNGCMVFTPHRAPMCEVPVLNNISWDYFDTHRKELLNLISWDEFVSGASW